MSEDVAAALGIDAGSTTVKLVAVDGKGNLLWHIIEPASPLVQQQTQRILEQAGAKAGSDALPLVATGYGRKLVVGAASVVTEITCHARGVFRAMGQGGTLIDIGGQDSKVIRIGAFGSVDDFAMNDKCAAGTGRFLENTASRVGVAIGDMERLALSTAQETPISSTCTVFAESEIISLLAMATPLESILRGLHRSLASRVAAMVRSVGLAPRVYLSGGVAQNGAIRSMLEQELKVDRIEVPDHPQLMGAYGAALTGLASVAGPR